jgi:hypothetical protein
LRFLLRMHTTCAAWCTKLRPFKIFAVLVTVSCVLLAAQVVLADEPPYPGGTNFFWPPYPAATERLGFGIATGSTTIGSYDVARLNAGWYVDWGTAIAPPHPDGLTYVQIVRLKGPFRSCLRACDAYRPTCNGVIDYRNCRTGFPANPASVSVSPSRSTIQQIAKANPGSLWAIGNEPDRISFMDDVCPDEYAMLYHELYTLIKAADPTAKITIGGIVQATPIRLQYLSIVWCVYQHLYGTELPVDLWNVHAFVLNEEIGSWGCDIPPGMVTASLLERRNLWDCDNMAMFKEQIYAFREWMADHGQRDKPLVVTEYGVLMPAKYSDGSWLCDGDPYHNDPLGRCTSGNGRPFDQPRVSAFMQATFDYFLGVDPDGIDADTGYPADGNRLVQAWNWYSLNEDWWYNGNLFSSSSKQITGLGLDFEAYAQPLVQDYRDLLPWGLSLQHRPDLFAGDPVTVTISSRVFDMGTMGAPDVTVRYWDGPPGIGSQFGTDQQATGVPSRYIDVCPTTVVTWTGAATSAHTFYVQVDPEAVITEATRSNNVISATLDFRSDLMVSSLVFTPSHPYLAGEDAVTVTINAVVSNVGHLAATGIPLDFWDGEPDGGGILIDTQELAPDPLDPLLSGQDVPVQALWTVDVPGKHSIFVRVDPDNTLAEIDESQNQVVGEILVAAFRLFMPTVLKTADDVSGQVRAGDVAWPGTASLSVPTLTPTP